MTTAFPTPCREPGCGIATKEGFCPDHKRPSSSRCRSQSGRMTHCGMVMPRGAPHKSAIRAPSAPDGCAVWRLHGRLQDGGVVLLDLDGTLGAVVVDLHLASGLRYPPK